MGRHPAPRREAVITKTKMAEIVKNCKDCGNQFTLSDSDQEYFASHFDDKGRPWSLPVRCKPCGKAKKANKRPNPLPEGGGVQSFKEAFERGMVEEDAGY